LRRIDDDEPEADEGAVPSIKLKKVTSARVLVTQVINLTQEINP
jgi:hypothetical protein